MDSSRLSSSVSPSLASAAAAVPPFPAQEFVRGELVHMFGKMAEALRQEDMQADMYVYGGAAIAMLHPDIRDVCADIDAFVPEYDRAGLALEDAGYKIAARDIAHRNHGEPLLDLNTLNLGDYITKGPRDAWSAPLDLGALKVRFLKAEGQLLFKMARRIVHDKDTDDMSALCDRLGVTSVADIRAIWRRHQKHLPHEAMRETVPSRINSRWQAVQQRRDHILARVR